jgi:hypothetical protein
MGEEFVLDEPEDFEDAIAALLRVDPRNLTNEPDAAVEAVVCHLCGLVIRDDDHVIAVEAFVPPVVHVACAEHAHLPPDQWEHTNVRTLSQWAGGMDWEGSA